MLFMLCGTNQTGITEVTPPPVRIPGVCDAKHSFYSSRLRLSFDTL